MLPDPGIPDVEVTPQAGWQDTTYQYKGSSIDQVFYKQPHAVTEVSSQSSVNSYQYDKNGNMICRTENSVTYKQTYNAENRIATIFQLSEGTCNAVTKVDKQWDFAYDGDGTRVKQSYTVWNQDYPQTVRSTSITAYYMGGAYEMTNGVVKKYYSFAGMTVAMRTGTELQYLLTDHLGSVVAVTDANGMLTSQQRYLPFGEVRADVGSIGETDFGYTGQRNLDSDIGLMDYNARFYSPYLNQFTQPDSIVPNLYNPQSLNRYSYVQNNPINLNDPTGHFGDSNNPCGVRGDQCTTNYTSSVTYSTNPGSGNDDDASNHGHSGNGHHSNDNVDGPLIDLNIDLDLFDDLPCNGLLNCNQLPQNNLLPFNGQDICGFMFHDDRVCNPNSWGFLLDPSNQYSIPYAMIFLWNAYTFNAIGIGGNVSGGHGILQGVGGVDALYLIGDNSGAAYIYGGPAPSTGFHIGGNGAVYMIFGFNIDKPSDYTGGSHQVNITSAWGYEGITAGYFWSRGGGPLQPGNPQGIIIGWAGGAKLAATYSPIFSTQIFP